MSQLVPISIPDTAYRVLDAKAQMNNQKIQDYILDAAMLDACGKTKSQFMEEMKKRK